MPPFVCRGCIYLLCSINYSLCANEYFIGCWTPSFYLPNLAMSLFSFLSLILPSPLSPSVWCRICRFWMYACACVCGCCLWTLPDSPSLEPLEEMMLTLCSVVCGPRVTLYCSGVLCACGCVERIIDYKIWKVFIEDVRLWISQRFLEQLGGVPVFYIPFGV